MKEEKDILNLKNECTEKLLYTIRDYTLQAEKSKNINPNLWVKAIKDIAVKLVIHTVIITSKKGRETDVLHDIHYNATKGVESLKELAEDD